MWSKWVFYKKKRDDQDSFRVNSPLSRPTEAIVIDTGAYSLEKMVEKVYQRAMELFSEALNHSYFLVIVNICFDYR